MHGASIRRRNTTSMVLEIDLVIDATSALKSERVRFRSQTLIEERVQLTGRDALVNVFRVGLLFTHL